LALVFLDTNILLRHFLADHEDHSPRASRAIAMIERGELQVRVSETVIFETVFMLSRRYKQPRASIGEAMTALLDLQGFVLPGKATFRRALEFYVDLNIPFADAFHAALAERLGISQIMSFDRDFDRVPDIERIEPE
jgi:predicted nucleic acid-binding protein